MNEEADFFSYGAAHGLGLFTYEIFPDLHLQTKHYILCRQVFFFHLTMMH